MADVRPVCHHPLMRIQIRTIGATGARGVPVCVVDGVSHAGAVLMGGTVYVHRGATEAETEQRIEQALQELAQSDTRGVQIFPQVTRS